MAKTLKRPIAGRVLNTKSVVKQVIKAPRVVNKKLDRKPIRLPEDKGAPKPGPAGMNLWGAILKTGLKLAATYGAQKALNGGKKTAGGQPTQPMGMGLGGFDMTSPQGLTELEKLQQSFPSATEPMIKLKKKR